MSHPFLIRIRRINGGILARILITSFEFFFVTPLKFPALLVKCIAKKYPYYCVDSFF